MTGTLMNDCDTLMKWALKLNFSPDRARKLIQRTPELKAMGVRFGPTRVYTPAEAEKIRDAVATIRRWKRKTV